MESKHEYTQGEKRMIVHSLDYFKALKDQKIFKGMSTRKLVADCLDYQLTDIEPTIRQFIERENKAVRPTTATGISIHMHEETGILLGERTMQRVLCELDYRYVKGENRHMYADSEANIAFAMRKRTANRVVTAVDRPEVYLAESFCNAKHVQGQTWLSSDNIRYNKSGKEDRACIVAAGIVASSGRTTYDKFVDGSIKCGMLKTNRKQGI
ncbi:hypothetical protein GQ600_405 [Phytophthora cactorum]|nr:hypothetical protein GQ600_405 [Phytophthora cactorum]